jgi:hypothetical protein
MALPEIKSTKHKKQRSPGNTKTPTAQTMKPKQVLNRKKNFEKQPNKTAAEHSPFLLKCRAGRIKNPVA